MLDSQSSASLRAVFAPKLSLIPTLTSVAARLPMAALTLFSSVASLLGAAGQVSRFIVCPVRHVLLIVVLPKCNDPSPLQGNYAAANAALDAWAHACQAAGGAARALQWGAWASSGMASEAVLKRLTRIGQGLISAEQGLAALGAALRAVPAGGRFAASLLPQLVVNGFLWGTYLKNSQSPFFTEHATKAEQLENGADASVGGGRAKGGSTKRAAGAVSSAATTVAALDPAALRVQVHSEVAGAIMQVLGAAIGDDEPLMSAGLDSLGSGASVLELIKSSQHLIDAV